MSFPGRWGDSEVPVTEGVQILPEIQALGQRLRRSQIEVSPWAGDMGITSALVGKAHSPPPWNQPL